MRATIPIRINPKEVFCVNSEVDHVSLAHLRSRQILLEALKKDWIVYDKNHLETLLGKNRDASDRLSKEVEDELLGSARKALVIACQLDDEVIASHFGMDFLRWATRVRFSTRVLDHAKGIPEFHPNGFDLLRELGKERDGWFGINYVFFEISRKNLSEIDKEYLVKLIERFPTSFKREKRKALLSVVNYLGSNSDQESHLILKECVVEKIVEILLKDRLSATDQSDERINRESKMVMHNFFQTQMISEIMKEFEKDLKDRRFTALRDATNEVWGLVFPAERMSCLIRLASDFPDQLRRSCVKLVKSLRWYEERKYPFVASKYSVGEVFFVWWVCLRFWEWFSPFKTKWFYGSDKFLEREFIAESDAGGTDFISKNENVRPKSEGEMDDSTGNDVNCHGSMSKSESSEPINSSQKEDPADSVSNNNPLSNVKTKRWIKTKRKKHFSPIWKTFLKMPIVKSLFCRDLFEFYESILIRSSITGRDVVSGTIIDKPFFRWMLERRRSSVIMLGVLSLLFLVFTSYSVKPAETTSVLHDKKTASSCVFNARICEGVTKKVGTISSKPLFWWEKIILAVSSPEFSGRMSSAALFAVLSLLVSAFGDYTMLRKNGNDLISWS